MTCVYLFIFISQSGDLIYMSSDCNIMGSLKDLFVSTTVSTVIYIILHDASCETDFHLNKEYATSSIFYKLETNSQSTIYISYLYPLSLLRQ
jgi:hypothetical protein